MQPMRFSAGVTAAGGAAVLYSHAPAPVAGGLRAAVSVPCRGLTGFLLGQLLTLRR